MKQLLILILTLALLAAFLTACGTPKICDVCGEEKNDCKDDTRLYGEDEPAPVCADCREILEALFEE